MTTAGRSGGRRDHPIHLDAAARALDALDAAEGAAFDAHLPGCETCRQELSDFLATAAVLGSAVAQRPAPGVRARVMARIAELPQQPPTVGTGSGPVGSRGAPVAGPGDPAAGPGDPGFGPGDPGFGPGDPPGAGLVLPIRRTWYRRPAALVAAAVLGIGIATTAVVLATRPAQPAAAGPGSMEECVATAPDATLMTPSLGAGGDVMMAHSCHAAVVRVEGLPALPSGQTYQLWVMAPSGARSVGMLGAVPDPQHVMVAGLREGDTDIRVSVEPAAGSAEPSSAPVWMVHLG
jgi:hypothetical protein